jgi:hypothetical protein
MLFGLAQVLHILCGWRSSEPATRNKARTSLTLNSSNKAKKFVFWLL